MSELIDRNALIEKLDGIWDCNDMVFEPDDCCDIISDCKSCKWRETKEAIKRIVLHMPTIDAAPVRHGEWVWLSSTYDRIPCEMKYRCSVCGHEEITHYGKEPWHNYCPNCGARMDGERRDDK